MQFQDTFIKLVYVFIVCFEKLTKQPIIKIINEAYFESHRSDT